MSETWRVPLKRGMSGEDVLDWQRVLVKADLLLPTEADRDFGARTEKGTIRFQLERGLTPDGEVGPLTRAATSVVPDTHPTIPGLFDPRWHFIQAHNFTPSAGRVVSMIVMHSMEAPDRPDTAEGVAAWFGGLRGKAPQASAHAAVDLDSIVLCVKPEDVAWGAQGANSCGYHVEQAGYAAQTREQWLARDGWAMLTLAASHVALACANFHLPVTALSRDEVAALIRDALIRQRKIAGTLSGHPGGICQHEQITAAWQAWAYYRLPNPRSWSPKWWPTHVDCGPGYPMDELIRRASASASATTRASAAP